MATDLRIRRPRTWEQILKSQTYRYDLLVVFSCMKADQDLVMMMIEYSGVLKTFSTVKPLQSSGAK